MFTLKTFFEYRLLFVSVLSAFTSMTLVRGCFVFTLFTDVG